MTTQQVATRARLQGLAFLVGTTGALAAMCVFAAIGLPAIATLALVTAGCLGAYALHLFASARKSEKDT